MAQTDPKNATLDQLIFHRSIVHDGDRYNPAGCRWCAEVKHRTDEFVKSKR